MYVSSYTCMLYEYWLSVSIVYKIIVIARVCVCVCDREFSVNNGLLWQCHFNFGELLTELRQANRALVVFEESLNYAGKNSQNKTLSLLQMALVCL